MDLVCSELRDLQGWGGHKWTQGHTLAMDLPAVPQAKMTPRASHSVLFIDPYCKQDQVTEAQPGHDLWHHC